MQAKETATRGIGRFARDLTTALLAHSTDDQFILYAVEGMDTSGIPTSPNATLRMLPPAPRAFGSDALEAADLSDLDALLILSPFQSFVYQNPCAPRLVSVIYDLIPETLPGLYCQEPAYEAAYENYLAALCYYDHILTMSASCRDDLIRLRDFDGSSITVVGTGANPIFSPATSDEERRDDAARLRALGIFDSGFILNVGHEDPRKGSLTLARAFSLLHDDLRAKRLVYAYNASEGHRVEVLGAAGIPGVCGDPELLHALGMDSPILFTGWMDDLSLRALYRNAGVHAFPSQAEGFGLPLLEAMKCGCPVIAGDNSSQIEAVGEAGLLVDATDPAEIAGAMELVLSESGVARSMSRLGLEQARRFEWQGVAERAMSAIRG